MYPNFTNLPCSNCESLMVDQHNTFPMMAEVLDSNNFDNN